VAARVKVIDLAKELGVTSKDLFVALEAMGQKGIRAMSPLQAATANALRDKFGRGRDLPEEAKPKRVLKAKPLSRGSGAESGLYPPYALIGIRVRKTRLNSRLRRFQLKRLLKDGRITVGEADILRTLELNDLFEVAVEALERKALSLTDAAVFDGLLLQDIEPADALSLAPQLAAEQLRADGNTIGSRTVQDALRRLKDRGQIPLSRAEGWATAQGGLPGLGKRS
jgi:hypothetical protein